MGVHDFISAIFVFIAMFCGNGDFFHSFNDFIVWFFMSLSVWTCVVMIIKNFRKISFREFKTKYPAFVKRIIEIIGRSNTSISCTLIIVPFSYILSADFESFISSAGAQERAYVFAATFGVFCIRWSQKKEISKENKGKIHYF